VTGSVAFTSTTFPISVAVYALFPWLASFASKYEQVRIHGMIAEFKSTSGSAIASTNNSLGTVIMATQYNPTDLPFTNKLQMENYEYSTSSKPSETFLHGVECKPGLTVAPELFTQQAAVIGSIIDPKLTTLGNFTIATVGMQAAVVVGELWISYEVELLKPRLDSTYGTSTLQLISTPVSGAGYLQTIALDKTTTVAVVGADRYNSIISSVFGNYTAVYSASGTVLSWNDPRLSGRTAFITLTSTTSTSNTTPIVNTPVGCTYTSYNSVAALQGGQTVGISLGVLVFNSYPTTNFSITLPFGTYTGTVQNTLSISIIR
jgi:hypothetical protein